MKKKTLVYIAPHLSTGGLPQYLFKQIESMVNDFDVYCIEWENVTGGVLVVQRNRIQKLLGNKLITLPENKDELFNILAKLNPEVIHLQEIPELFMPHGIADKLYTPSRTYKLIETSHDSSYDTRNKLFFPDKFLMVSKYQINQYRTLGIPVDLVEYPIEHKVKTKTREQALRDLGLDPNLKHVINVGLFTPRKNQAEVIEYARMMQQYPIQFHFLGNHADNFKYYWEPLMKDFPSNCKWWNERSDVDAFYEAADLFLFTSRGHATDKETMPLVIRESLSWKTPSLIYNLPVYLNYFDKFDSISYLTESTENNVELILHKLGISSQSSVFFTMNGEEKLNEIQYTNSADENTVLYGDGAGQYFATFIRTELERSTVTIEQGDVFVDLGANIGMSSKYAAMKGAELHCFEPDPKMIDILKKNVPSARIYPFAISPNPKELELHHWPHNHVTGGPTYKCKAITLREVLRMVGKPIDYLKIDIEGFEENLFDDITKDECNKINKMMIEHHNNNTLDTFINKLKVLGFDIAFLEGGFQTFVYAQNSQFNKHQFDLNSVQTNECIVVTTYPNSSRLVEMTKQTLLRLKKYNLPIILSSNYPLSDELQQLADYCVVGKNNILDFNGTQISNFWSDYPDLYVNVNLSKDNIPPYTGPAAHASLYDGIALAKLHGFDIAHTFSFDMEIYDSWFAKMRKELQTRSMVIHKTNYQGTGEGEVIRPECVSVKTDFFLDTFPKISSLQEYYNWMHSLNSSTTTLERLWYLEVQNKVDDVYFIEDEELHTIIDKNDERGKHRTGFIFEVLPIENDSSNMLLLFKSANVPALEYESVRVFLNGKLHTTLTNNTWHEIIPRKNIHQIRCELYDVKRQQSISYRERFINDSYFEIPNIKQASVVVKQTPQFNKTIMTPITEPFGFNARWDLNTQTMYYSCQQPVTFSTIISIREYKSDAVLWAVDADRIDANCEYWIIPINKSVFSYENDPHFTGVKICIYNKETGEQIYEQPFFHKFLNIPTVTLSNFLPYRLNYIEFFVDRQYAKWIDKNYKLVVDIGANAGIFTEYMLRNQFAQRVVAVECDSTALKDLQKNFKNNSLVTIIPKAFSYSETPITFYEFTKNPLVSTTLSPDQIKNHGSGLTSDRTTTVETVTLQQIINEHNTIDLLKIDIEGAEYDIILNADDTLFSNVNHMFIECHFMEPTYNEKYKAMVKKLERLGYTVEEDKPNQVDNVESRFSESIYVYRA
jgi:FkbM family methyltransferase